jgi:transcriptional regulator with XRE-family HTH domain
MSRGPLPEPLAEPGSLRRTELADFLRTRRARLRPAEVGLPEVGHRRTPGLRRQEVAQLAGMSVDYYIRLEQGRGPRPSRQIVGALARALMLNIDEREYLYRITGESPPAPAGLDREVPAAIRILLDTLPHTPAYVLDAKYDVLAWNDMATHFIGDLRSVPAEYRNIIRWMFTRPAGDPHWTDEEHVRFARSCVADLRAAYARYPGDRGIAELVTELNGTSPRFARMWADHDVEVRRQIVKRIDHPVGGHLEFECQVLHVPDNDQRLIIYCAVPGSPTDAAFRRLATMPAPRLTLPAGSRP